MTNLNKVELQSTIEKIIDNIITSVKGDLT